MKKRNVKVTKKNKWGQKNHEETKPNADDTRKGISGSSTRKPLPNSYLENTSPRQMSCMMS
jgi:hypothetical protein